MMPKNLIPSSICKWCQNSPSAAIGNTYIHKYYNNIVFTYCNRFKYVDKIKRYCLKNQKLY